MHRPGEPMEVRGQGLAIGIATATRSEALSPASRSGSRGSGLRRTSADRTARLAVFLLAGDALVVGPWVIRNDLQLGAATLSTDTATTLAGAYAPTTYVRRAVSSTEC